MDNYVPLREVARIVWFMKQENSLRMNNVRAPIILDLCRERAGISSFSPRPEDALSLLEQIDMVRRVGRSLILSPECVDLIVSSESPLYLNEEQKEIIYGTLLSHNEIGGKIRDLFARCNVTGDGYSAISTDTVQWADEELEWITYILQELNILCWDGSRLKLNKEGLRISDPGIFGVVAMEESMLEEILLFQKKIAREAEDFIVEWEKQRLDFQGDSHLKNLVRRVSSENVLLGYDVASVEGGRDGDEDRFIEVKSSCGTNVSFYWTTNEMNCAKRLGENYWLYFVPRANILPGKRPCVHIIGNPIRHLGKTLKYKEKSLHVWFESEKAKPVSLDFGHGWLGKSF